MRFETAIKASSLIETLENYCKADNTDFLAENRERSSNSIRIHDNDQFWQLVLTDTERCWNKKMQFNGWIVSDWIARVPGLYWMNESRNLRSVPEELVEKRSERWITYFPPGKSRKVMGGLGTFVLRPDEKGYVIMSLTNTGNTSTSVPVLVSPEVIEHFNLAQGKMVTINSAPWRKMSQEWSNRFPAIKGLPRGYIVLDEPDQIEVDDVEHPVEVQPFTILEYDKGNGVLYDFVYYSIDTAFPNYRKEIEKFFAEYCKSNKHYGHYLIAADTTDPLFEAEYNTPEELLRNEIGAKANLDLLTARIRNAFLYKNETIDSIIDKVSKYYNIENSVYSLAIKVNIPTNKINSGPPVKMISQLINICKESGKLEELVDQVQHDYPSSTN
jgi:hypothetical protein